eukprot:11340838-Ditylum_brightwellii.AAC.1
MSSGVIKKVVVSVWGIARPHPDKPQNFAQVLAKKYVVMGGYKKDERMNSLFDLLSVECEIANKHLKHVDEIQYYD